MKKLISKNYYFVSLGIVLLMSFYPLRMGARLLRAYIHYGYVNATDYPKYVIPYTPIAIALIISVAVLPLAFRFFKKLTLPAVSILGVGLFLLFEVLFEKVTVFSYKEGIADVGSWQMYLCRALTPEEMGYIPFTQTVGEALTERYSPVFKIHFYLIAILIVLAVLGVVYGFWAMARDKSYDKKKPLIVQTSAVAVFIGLCIFACFTAFYRTGELKISALSSWLMSVFFIVFGITAGAYAGGLLYFKRPLVSRFIPTLIASATTLAMYFGELALMGGVLYKFGDGFLFDPLGTCPFAVIDLFVITASGLIAYALLFLIRNKGIMEKTGGGTMFPVDK